MKKLFFIAAGVAASTAAHAASVDLGGRFYPGMSSGYVDAIAHNFVASDGTGDSPDDLINFSTPPITPAFEVVTLNTPNYGVVTAEFTSLVSFEVNAAGEFFTLGGNFDGSGYGTLSVNLVQPGFGISSFGLIGNFTYTEADPPPPPVVSSDPPLPCLDCGPPVVSSDPPPSCLNCGTPVVPSVPETSTWLMLLTGFAALAYRALRTGTSLARTDA
jgi:hypothetical protein